MVARAVTKKPPPAFEIVECEQGSEEWHQHRLGIPTTSVFGKILASGRSGDESKERTKLLNRLAGEVMTGIKAETFRSKAMERGNEMEVEARAFYERSRLVDLELIGFVRRKLPSGRYVGCSPDGFVGSNKVLEIKTMIPELMIPLSDKGAAGLPTAHLAQCQGAMWITDRTECDLMIYYRNMPVAPTFRIERSDVYIKHLAEQVEVFDYEIHKVVERMKARGP